MSDVNIGYTLARLTRPDGKAATLRGGSLSLSPIIEPGREHVESGARWRGPDKFIGWEIELVLPWRRIFALGIRSQRWQRSALEFWTNLENPEWDEYTHTQWVFPYVQWQRHGLRRWRAVTHEGPPVTPDGIPDGMPITQGAWWKVKEVPSV